MKTMKTRSIKELLQVMLDNQDLFDSGLCRWNLLLRGSGNISIDEHIMLIDYIHDNRPSMWSSVYAFKNRNNAYYWEYGDIQPRITWIEKHIKKLS
jgi:hypothetical protein